MIENAPFNVGNEQVYVGVGSNLFAFACQLSFEKGYQGFVAFEAKTSLVNYYAKSLGAIRIGNSLQMYIDTEAARKLISYCLNE